MNLEELPMSYNPYDLTNLWTQGDTLIRSVAIVLLLMSVLSWYVIATRTWRAMRLRRMARAATGFWHTQSFAEGLALLDGHGADNPFRHVAAEGQVAVDHHKANGQDLHGQLSLAEWLTESLRGAIDESTERLQGGLAILASIGSTAPFVGLFGTVWGIYHALVGIGLSGQPSVDKVAGPVGEALIMTAFGLAVAIPAVLAYNALLRTNKGVINKLNRFARQLHAFFLTGSPVTRETAKVMPIRRQGG
jgi:biopolymer transport protein ExbB